MHYPEHMMLEVTAKCNFRCPYCYTKYYDRKEQPMKPFARMILVTSLALAAGCASTLKVNNAPVAALDLNRYLGEWYEIARFDHSFERGYDTDKLIWVRQGKEETTISGAK